MATSPNPPGRSLVATVIGWVIVAIIAWWLLGFIIGTLRWIIRSVLIVLVLLVLISLYLRFKDPPDT